MNPPQDHEETIFESALQLSPEKRPAHLREACGDDAPLRERVELLLKSHEAAGRDYLEKPRALDPNSTMVVSPLPPSEEMLGTLIGRYKLLEKIGEGGFGVVYVAEQREPVKRRVALKIIKLGMDTKQVVARFEVERQSLALMDHPNIAKVFDAGATEKGRPYFIMELVRGIRITDYCDQNNLCTHERLELFTKVCQAIQHAHQKGIIHRDIKPSNILVTLHDGVPVPKVIDFGIAKATQGELSEHTVYTKLQQFIGTPAYMSPEQAEMSGLDIDTRSDIYALGVLLYELLTGRTPFDQKELLDAGLDGMRRMIREQEPQRPSTRVSSLQGADRKTTARRHGLDAPKLVNLLQGDLDWIVMKCLEKDRTRRYETANGLAADLKRHLDNEPVQARPPSAAYKFQKAWRRNKLAFAAATAVATALVGGMLVSAWQAVRANREARRATTAEAVARGRLADSEAISTFLTEVFQSPDPARDGRTITVAEMLDRAARKLETDLAAQPARRVRLLAALGSTYDALGLDHEAIPIREKVRDYYRATAGPEQPETLDAMATLAISYHSAGRLGEALKLQEEVMALSRTVNGPAHPNTLNAMVNLATSFDSAGRFDKAIRLMEEALTLGRKINDPQPAHTPKMMGNLANSYLSAGRLSEALKLQEEALASFRKVSGPEHPDTIKALNGLANSYFASGRRVEALKMREEALGLSRKVNGPEHPDTLIAMGNLAISCADSVHRDESRKLLEELVAIRRKVSGPEHPATLNAMSGLALSYFDSNRRDEALKLEEEVLALHRKVNGPEHPHTLLAVQNLAVSYANLGRRDEALKLQELVFGLSRKVNGPEHPATLTAMNNLATYYDNAGLRDEALKMLEEVLTLHRKVIGPEHPDTLMAMNNLANLYDSAGRRDEALKLREEVLRLGPTVNGPDHPHTLTAMNNLAASYANLGRRDEALKLREEVLRLRRKVIGPEHPDTLTAMKDLAASYDDQGRRDGALQLREEELALCLKVNGPDHPETLRAMIKLVDSYAVAGRYQEAIALLAKYAEKNNGDTGALLRLAAWQAWFSLEADYEIGRHRMVDGAEGTKEATTAERIAKACSLRPSSDPDLRSKALILARRAVELGPTHKWLPYFRLALGMAEYRAGLYPAGEQTLALAEETAGDWDDILHIARPYRVMSLVRLGRTDEALALFRKAEAAMPQLPPEESKPQINGEPPEHDVLIGWMAYKEAKALLNARPARQP